MTVVASTPSGRPASPSAGGRVVVGIDDSPGGLAALRWAIGLARSRGARLVAVRAWALGLPRHGGLRRRGVRTPVVLVFRGIVPAQEAWNLACRAFRDVGGVPGDLDVTIETPEGSPGPVLTQIASGGDDVLVVGTRTGLSLQRAVHGSVSAYCTVHADCPVTVVAPRRRPGLSPDSPGAPAPRRMQAGGPARGDRR